MNLAAKRAVLSALKQSHVLITADRTTHYESNRRPDGSLPLAERALARAYTRAIKAIDKAIEVIGPLDAPSSAIAPQQAVGRWSSK